MFIFVWGFDWNMTNESWTFGLLLGSPTVSSEARDPPCFFGVHGNGGPGGGDCWVRGFSSSESKQQRPFFRRIQKHIPVSRCVVTCRFHHDWRFNVDLWETEKQNISSCPHLRLGTGRWIPCWMAGEWTTRPFFYLFSLEETRVGMVRAISSQNHLGFICMSYPLRYPAFQPHPEHIHQSTVDLAASPHTTDGCCDGRLSATLSKWKALAWHAFATGTWCISGIGSNSEQFLCRLQSLSFQVHQASQLQLVTACHSSWQLGRHGMSEFRRSCGEIDLPFDSVEILPGPNCWDDS